MSPGRTPAEIGPVMVGVDFSDGSQAGVDLGAWEAGRRQVPLVLVHGHMEPIPAGAYGWLPRGSTTMGDDARIMLARLEQRTQADHQGLTVRATLVAGGGASTLVELSRIAGLVVVGSRGVGGFTGLLLGSVSAQVAAHAHAPVIVVRTSGGDTRQGERIAVPLPGRVVVGIDNSPQSAEALRFALDEAQARRVPVSAVYAWFESPADILGGIPDPKASQAEAEQALARAVGAWSDKYSDVIVHRVVVHSYNPASALLEASVGAGLLVVGSRGRGGFKSLLLGSVSHTVLAHASCPVAVAREYA